MGMNAFDKSENELIQDDDPWDIDSDTEEEEEIQDDGLLTMLVRKSYLKHLERCLKKNYEESLDKELIPPSQLTEVINFHAQFLEKRALKASVRVGIYQRHMVKAIDEIKKATKKNAIHPTFCRRKFRKKGKVDRDTQTEDNPKTEKTDVQNMLSSAFGFSPGYSGEHEGIDSYEELLNILTASPNLKESQANAEDDSMMSDHCEEVTICRNNSFHASPKRMNLDERLQQLGLWCDDDEPAKPVPPVLVPPVEGLTVKLDSLETLAPKISPKNPLPWSHEVEDQPTTRDSFEGLTLNVVHRTHVPSNWSHEVALQTQLVETILRRKSPFKRAIIERRFKDLFGVFSEIAVPTAPSVVEAPHLDLPPGKPSHITVQPDSPELLDSRRNLAGHVVKALTPFYIEHRIGSRVVFKNLAKRITDRLLNRSLHPDPKEAKKEVKICFALKPEILSSKDIEKVFSQLM